MRRRLAVLVAVALAALVGCSGGPGGSSTTPAQVTSAEAQAIAGTAGLCGRRSSPATYRHVVWVVLENHSYEDLVGRPGSQVAGRSPYLNRLVRACGLATSSWAVTHPSLPNYLAMVSGGTGGVTSDCGTSDCPQHRRTVFDQVSAAGGSWRTLAESMPGACVLSSSGRYAAKHNPATYFPALRADCRRWDLPMGTTRRGRLVRMVHDGRLPSFLLVVPNQCHNTHDCPVPDGDAWLSKVVPLLTGGPNYRAGDTAVFLTWDEGSGGSGGQRCRADRDRSCHIVTAVVAPSTAPGTRSRTRFDHYALLKTTEQLLGLPLLGQAAAATTPSMTTAFRL